MALIFIGVMVGLAGAVALTRVLSGQLFGVSATDPLTFLAVPAILIMVALVACVVPAKRALAVDPASVIRSED
jgi:putative ABC transport system permease protein